MTAGIGPAQVPDDRDEKRTRAKDAAAGTAHAFSIVNGLFRQSFTFFFIGFCRHLPLLLTLLFLIGLTFGLIGQSLGLSYLAWNESLLQQGLVGFALGLVCIQILITSYLLQARPARHILGSPSISWYSAGVAFSAIVSLVIVWLLYQLLRVLTGPSGGTNLDPLSPGSEARSPPWPYRGYPLLGGAILAILAVVAAIRIFSRTNSLPQHRTQAGPMLVFCISALFYTVVYFLPFAASPILAICLLLSASIVAYGFLARLNRRYVIILIFLALCLGFLSGIPIYKHRFNGLEEYYENQPSDLEKYDEVQRQVPLLSTKSIEFCAKAYGPAEPAGKKRPLVVVCVSGGGIRAAAWTLAILQRLEREFRLRGIEFPYHIRLLSGASGGMVACAFYAASLPPPGSARPQTWPDDDYERITRDTLSPVVRQMVYGDLWKNLLPMPCAYDRGAALEDAWRNNLNGQLEKSFADLAAGEREGWRPSLAFSPMLIEDGRRLLISNLDLHAVALNDSSASGSFLEPGAHSQIYSWEALEFFRLFPSETTRRDFKLSTAARMSASFPYISPAGILPTKPRRRVVDAGYYDNYGVSIAAAWLMSGHTRRWLERNISGVLLIQIRDVRSLEERTLRSVPTNDDSSPASRALEELTSPISALYNARAGTASFGGDEQLELLTRALNNELQIQPLLGQLTKGEIELLRSLALPKDPLFLHVQTLDLAKHTSELRESLIKGRTPAEADALLSKIFATFDRNQGSPFFATALFELDRSASLSWYLTRSEKEAIWAAANHDSATGEDEVRKNPDAYPVAYRIYRIYDWWMQRPNSESVGN